MRPRRYGRHRPLAPPPHCSKPARPGVYGSRRLPLHERTEPLRPRSAPSCPSDRGAPSRQKGLSWERRGDQVGGEQNQAQDADERAGPAHKVDRAKH